MAPVIAKRGSGRIYPIEFRVEGLFVRSELTWDYWIYIEDGGVYKIYMSDQWTEVVATTYRTCHIDTEFGEAVKALEAFS